MRGGGGWVFGGCAVKPKQAIGHTAPLMSPGRASPALLLYFAAPHARWPASFTAPVVGRELVAALAATNSPAFAERRHCQSAAEPFGVGGRHSEVKEEARQSLDGGHGRRRQPTPTGLLQRRQPHA